MTTTRIIRHNGGWTNYVHLGCIICAALAHDGQRVASSATFGQCLIRDALTDEILVRMNGHWGSVGWIVWAPQDATVATACSDGTARIWDPTTGEQLLAPLAHPMTVTSVEFWGDGKQLVTSCWDGNVRIWDASTGNLIRQVRVSDGPVRLIAPSPDNSNIVAIVDGVQQGKTDEMVLIRDSGICVRQSIHLPASYRVRWTSDAMLFALACDSAVRTYRIDGETLVLEGEYRVTGQPTSVDFSLDGARLCVGSENGLVQITNVETKTVEAEFKAHDDMIWSLQWDQATGHLLTVSSDGTVALWRDSDFKLESRLARFSRGIYAVDASPDGKRIVSCSAEGHFCLWDVDRRLAIGEFAAHRNWIRSAKWAQDGARFLTASQDGTIGIWDADGGRLIEPFDLQIGALWAAVWATNDDVAAVSSDGHLCVVNPTDPTPVRRIKLDNDWLRALTWSSSGTFAVCGGDSGKIWMIRSPDLSVLWHIELHQGCFDCALSPNDSVLAVALADGTIRLIDTKTRQTLGVLRGHTSQVWSVRFARDGNTLVSAGADGSVRVWSLQSEERTETKVYRLPTPCVAARFLPSGEILFGSSGAWTLDPRTAAESPGSRTKTLTDSPVALLDGPAQSDVLGRSPLVEELAFFLHRTADFSRERSMPGSGPDGFVVHVGGKWGSGKTTLVHELVRRVQKSRSLEKSSPPPDSLRHWDPVFFGAWEHADIAPAWWSIAMAIRSHLLRGKNGLGKLAFRFREIQFRFPGVVRNLSLLLASSTVSAAVLILYAAPALASYLRPAGASNGQGRTSYDVASLIATAVTIGIPAIGVLVVTARLGSRARRRWRWPHRDSSDIDLDTEWDFSALPREYLRWIRWQVGSDLLLIIDDLDRCTREYIWEIISTIQVMTRADELVSTPSSRSMTPPPLPKSALAILVIADRRWVEGAVTAHLHLPASSSHGIARGKTVGGQFLEKIFTASVELPRLSVLQRQVLVRSTVDDTGSTSFRDVGYSHVRDVGNGALGNRSEIEELIERIEALEPPDKTEMEAIVSKIVSSDPANREPMALLLAQRINRPEFRAAEETQLLEDYAGLMESTPRGVKRTLVSFWLNRALAQLAATEEVPGDEAIMRWTILSLRWPSLVEELELSPQSAWLSMARARLGSEYLDFENIVKGFNVAAVHSLLTA